MTLDTTLLDLDRAPMILEMRAFFKKHDWSAAIISKPKSRTSEDHETSNYIRRIMDEAFEQEARARGLAARSGYFDNPVLENGEKIQNNPLFALLNSVEDLVSDGVRMLLTGPDEIVDGILSQFNFDDPALDKKADDFLHTAVSTMLDVMEYDQLAGIVQDISATEDFNPYIKPNFRAQDHNILWYHTDAKVKVENCPNPEIMLRPDQATVDSEKNAIFDLMMDDYWMTLDDTEKKLRAQRELKYLCIPICKVPGILQ